MRLARLSVHAVVGAVACAALAGLLLRAMSTPVAMMVHVAAAPLVFAVVAWSYFRSPVHFSTIPVAVVFAGTSMAVDLLFARIAHHRHLVALPGMWIGFILIFVMTCVTSALLSAQPWKKAL